MTACRIPIISFSYVDLPKCLPESLLLSNGNGCPSCINATPMPFPGASHSITNGLLQSGVASTGVEHIASSRVLKDLVASSDQANALFLGL